MPPNPSLQSLHEIHRLGGEIQQHAARGIYQERTSGVHSEWIDRRIDEELGAIRRELASLKEQRNAA